MTLSCKFFRQKLVLLMKAWPFLYMLLIYLIHKLYLELPCLFNDELKYLCLSNRDVDVNQFLSFIMQIVGGVIVLYSISSNIYMFKGYGLRTLINNWFGSMISIKSREITLSVDDLMEQQSLSSVAIRTLKKPETIEEAVEQLSKKIKWMQEDQENVNRDIHKKIEFLSVNIENQNQVISSNFVRLNKLIEDLSIGSFKLELFGVMLLIYGSICAFISNF